MAIPILASALPGIASFLAGKGMDMLSGLFKGAVNKGMEEVTNAIHEQTGIDINDAADGKLSSEEITKLKEFELKNEELILEHSAKQRELDIEEEKIHQKDREDARDLQKAALKSGDKFASWFIYLYATLITLLTFGYIFMVTFWDDLVPGENTRIVDTVLGFLLGVSLSAIIQFFFGSSSGSSEKQIKIHELSMALAQSRKNKLEE